MSRVPPYDPPVLAPKPDLTMVRQVREYRLITPLFGGGVDPRAADPISTVRATEVRGQLRFWWRATRGGQFGADLSALKHAEDLLWGAASSKEHDRPSQVQLEVQVLDAGKPDAPFEVYEDTDKQGRRVYRTRPRKGSLVPAYAAFPLQPSRDELRAWNPRHDEVAAVRVGVRFRLILSYPTVYQSDLNAALWAWETFGGLGARTRRGFGAIQCTKVDGKEPTYSKVGTVATDIREMLEACTGTWHADVPHLDASVSLRIIGDNPDAHTIWQHMIDRLRRLRQTRNQRTDQPKRPGRSRWPEPDEIRRRVPKHYTRHAQPISDVRAFPRAAFGLPIIFHFQDQYEDPGDTTLKGATTERLASPLILRPLACDGNRFVEVALVLRAPRVPSGGLVLEGATSTDPICVDLTPDDARSITDQNLRPLLGAETDVLQAFLNFLEK